MLGKQRYKAMAYLGFSLCSKSGEKVVIDVHANQIDVGIIFSFLLLFKDHLTIMHTATC